MNNAFGGVFRGLRVLVTGHTGFKGSWLSIWLKELGAEVIGYGLGPPTTTNNFDLSHLADRITDVRGDVRDLQKLMETIEEHEPEVVIHMAAQPLVLIAYQKPKETFDTNVGGTVNILEAIRRTGSVRAFVGVTTDKVYEDQAWVWGYREKDILGGHDPYSASKGMAELAIQSYRRSWPESGFADHLVAIASARSGNVIGGGDWGAHRLVPDSMRDLINGEKIQVNTPESIRPWMVVFEPLSGYLWLAAKLHSEGQAFAEAWNFGPLEHEAVTCRALAQKASDLWGGHGIVVPDIASDSMPHQTQVLRLNWDKAANYLNWRPAYAWEDAVGETVKWFQEYSRRAGVSESIDMYDVCAEHLEEYVNTARGSGLAWAVSS